MGANKLLGQRPKTSWWQAIAEQGTAVRTAENCRSFLRLHGYSVAIPHPLFILMTVISFARKAGNRITIALGRREKVNRGAGRDFFSSTVAGGPRGNEVRPSLQLHVEAARKKSPRARRMLQRARGANSWTRRGRRGTWNIRLGREEPAAAHAVRGFPRPARRAPCPHLGRCGPQRDRAAGKGVTSRTAAVIHCLPAVTGRRSRTSPRRQGRD